MRVLRSISKLDPVDLTFLACLTFLTIYYGVLSWPFIIILIVDVLVGIKIYFKLTLGMTPSTRRIDGQVAIVTGANAGMGFETAKELARRGGKVIMACRNFAKGEEAAGRIRKEVRNADVIVIKLDLTSLKSVRQFSNEILEKQSRLDILVNNAGGLMLEKVMTEDNLESVFTGNHFGPFLLTNLLLGLMKKTGKSRIVMVSSQMHYLCRELDLDNLNSEKFFQVDNVYASSKLANILFMRELDRRLRRAGISGITVNALCPGLVRTSIFEYTKEVWYRHIFNRICDLYKKTAWEGAQTQIHLAVADEVDEISGRYWTDCTEANVSAIAQDTKLAKALWEKCAQTVRLKPEETIF